MDNYNELLTKIQALNAAQKFEEIFFELYGFEYGETDLKTFAPIDVALLASTTGSLILCAPDWAKAYKDQYGAFIISQSLELSSDVELEELQLEFQKEFEYTFGGFAAESDLKKALKESPAFIVTDSISFEKSF